MKKVRLSYSTLSEYSQKKYGKSIEKNPPRPQQKIVKPIPKKKLIDRDILEILESAYVQDNILFLDSGSLDRKTYLKVNKVLESLGGQWNRNKKGHVFDEDPQEILDNVINTGFYEKESDFGYFPTPAAIVEKIIEYAKIEPHHTILEPSAGQGHIIEGLESSENVVCGELLERNREILIKKGFRVKFENFLEHHEKYDRIIMNPSFVKQADIDHVNHAYSLLNPGGKLVSVMSQGVTFRTNKKTVEFRKLIDEKGLYEELPENSFHTSGTEVNTVLVVLNK